MDRVSSSSGSRAEQQQKRRREVSHTLLLLLLCCVLSTYPENTYLYHAAKMKKKKHIQLKGWRDARQRSLHSLYEEAISGEVFRPRGEIMMPCSKSCLLSFLVLLSICFYLRELEWLDDKTTTRLMPHNHVQHSDFYKYLIGMRSCRNTRRILRWNEKYTIKEKWTTMIVMIVRRS